jgi:hypothetical protein
MNKSIFSINSLSKYSHLFQIVGVIGLIASLIFVGLELRQTQKIAINAQNQARSETVIEYFKFLHENDLPIYVWIKEGIKEKDRDIVSTSKHIGWTLYNNDYSQYKSNLMEKDLFEAKRDNPITQLINGNNYLECIISKEVWDSRKNNFQPDFVELINSLSIPCDEMEK